MECGVVRGWIMKSFLEEHGEDGGVAGGLIYRKMPLERGCMEVRIIVVAELLASCTRVGGEERSAGGIEEAAAEGRTATGGDAVVMRSSTGEGSGSDSTTGGSGTSSATDGAGAGSATFGEELESETIITASGAGEAEENDSFVDAVVCTEVQMMAKTL